MRTAFKARYVFPVVSPPIEDGVVTIDEGQVVHVGREPVGCSVTDLGNVAILPGLINAHSHLEFSGLESPLGSPGMSLPEWIRLVVDSRRHWPVPFRMRDLNKGASECGSTGTVAIGEIATTACDSSYWLPLRAAIFREVIGLKRELIGDRLAAANKHFAEWNWPSGRPGLSPHAPYTVHPELFDGLLDVARKALAPVAFHLAESLDELDLLATDGGPFRKLLIELGAWDETAIPRGTRPMDYLHRLAKSGVHALVVHGNYLDDEEIKLVAAHPDRLTVVYCPRTHAYFGHSRHPLPWLIASGGNVALGTDSRASNPDLNLLEEIRFVAGHFPELPAGLPLELGTLRAARALQVEQHLGSIEPGKLARMISVPLSNSDARDPHWLVYESLHPATPLATPPWSGR
jgi:aminodeoxyfutalosine deaminase